MNLKQFLLILFIIYILFVIKYFIKLPTDSVLYIEDEPVKYIENNGKLTIYEKPPNIIKTNWYELKHNNIHRFFYTRQFYCNIPKDTQLQIFVFPPTEHENLYSKTNIFKLYQYSDINIFNPDIDKYPNFKKAECIEFSLINQQVLVLPKGWWIYIENPSYMLTKILI